MNIRAPSLIILLLALHCSVPAHADCSDPARPEGAIIYNSVHHTAQFCDGTAWWSMKGMQEVLPACVEGDGIVMSSAGWACSPGEPP